MQFFKKIMYDPFGVGGGGGLQCFYIIDGGLDRKMLGTSDLLTVSHI